MAGYYREIVALLKDAGWELFRSGKGSHETWWNPATGEKQTVPYDCKKRHTANGILKDAGLPKKF